MAESHIFLASLYKQFANASNPKFFENSPDYDPKNGQVIFHANQAIDIFLNINQFTQVAKAQFVLASFYLSQNKKQDGCDLYDQSMVNYKKGIKLNPNLGFTIYNFKDFPEMVATFKRDHCE